MDNQEQINLTGSNIRPKPYSYMDEKILNIVSKNYTQGDATVEGGLNSNSYENILPVPTSTDSTGATILNTVTVETPVAPATKQTAAGSSSTAPTSFTRRRISIIILHNIYYIYY